MNLLRTWTPLALALCLSGVALGAQTPAPGPAPSGQNSAGQGPGAPTGGLTREQMWYAPTEEDWAKPCLIQWQRTYADALRVSEETGKAVLVCVNMDGEIASEHYAGIRYRQAEIAKLYEPYVCVIASTYRHNPRDYDENGERILCPRFGSVTCAEHISIEPGLYKEFLDDTRVAPRHIMVEQDGIETYDVYYAFDTESVFNTIRAGIEERPDPIPTVDRGDQSLLERVSSRDVQDRMAIEEAYRVGDREIRRQLLTQATNQKQGTQVDLLRLALFGDDAELSQVAWRSLVKTESIESLPLITEVLAFSLEAEERDALIECLTRLGESSPKAKRLARVHRGLADPAQGLPVALWRNTLAAVSPEATWPSNEELRAALEAAELRLSETPEDSAAVLSHAAALYGFAYQRGLDPKLSRLALQDAYTAVKRARELGAVEGWESESLLAVCARATRNWREAYAAAVRAVQYVPTNPGSWRAKETLATFVEARQRAIYRGMMRQEDWPTSWLSDVHGGFALLADHPHARAEDLARQHDYLKALNAKGYATSTLELGFERFPGSNLIHARLRARLLEERDLDSLGGLEETYEAMLRSTEGHTPKQVADLHWYAGYASLVAAEFHRRAGDAGSAATSYDRSMVHFENAAVLRPDTADSSDHFIALARAGKARLALEAEEYAIALDELLACFRSSPTSARNLDGLGITPVMTATTLGARLTEQGKTEEFQRLQLALAALPPEMLEAPDFERVAPGTGEAGRSGLRRGRQRRDR